MTGASRADVLMLVLPLPVYRVGGQPWLDTQAQNGLRLTLQNFERVILCLPAIDAGAAPGGTSSLDLDAFGERIELVELPDTRRPLAFWRALPATRRVLRAKIAEARYLHLSIGGLWGDWAAVTANLARRMGRPFAVWTDRVESKVAAYTASQSRGLRRLHRYATAWAMGVYERRVIRRAPLGLFHGGDCFESYRNLPDRAFLVHDIHVDETRRIDAAALAAKAERNGPLDIVYVGRAHPDKGVADWIATLADAASRGVAFTATWYGTGPELDSARERVTALDLADRIAFPGNLGDRDALFARITAADLFLFCHQTPESPRCLLEALICGTPIVGYASAFSTDLIAQNGGGVLTDAKPHALAAAATDLARDRSRLATLMHAAAADGLLFVDHEVFRHRSDLLKRYA